MERQATRRRVGEFVTVGLCLSLLLAGCGGAPRHRPAGQAVPAVSLRMVDGLGAVLVDRSGHTLYVNDADRPGAVACVGQCARVWPALIVPAGARPVAATQDVSAVLGTVRRVDGGTQVTVGGRPLYEFSLDTVPGQAGGEAKSDSFGGVAFRWQAVTADLLRPPPSTCPSCGMDY